MLHIHNCLQGSAMGTSNCLYYYIFILSVFFTKEVQSEIGSSQEDLVKKLTEALEALKYIGHKGSNDIIASSVPETNSVEKEPELKNDIFQEFEESSGKFTLLIESQ